MRQVRDVKQQIGLEFVGGGHFLVQSGNLLADPPDPQFMLSAGFLFRSQDTNLFAQPVSVGV